MVSFSHRVGRKGSSEALGRAYRAFPVLAERRKQLGGTLSGGQQRILSLAKVLAVPPRLLIVDELSLGLAPVIVDQVYDGLIAIHDEGCALLVVEQQVDRVLAIADRAVLLVKGAVAWEGPARDARPTLEARMLGGGPSGNGVAAVSTNGVGSQSYVAAPTLASQALPGVTPRAGSGLPARGGPDAQPRADSGPAAQSGPGGQPQGGSAASPSAPAHPGTPAQLAPPGLRARPRNLDPSAVRPRPRTARARPPRTSLGTVPTTRRTSGWWGRHSRTRTDRERGLIGWDCSTAGWRWSPAPAAASAVRSLCAWRRRGPASWSTTSARPSTARAPRRDPAAETCRLIEEAGGKAVPNGESVADFDGAGRIIGPGGRHLRVDRHPGEQRRHRARPDLGQDDVGRLRRRHRRASEGHVQLHPARRRRTCARPDTGAS